VKVMVLWSLAKNHPKFFCISQTRPYQLLQLFFLSSSGC